MAGVMELRIGHADVARNTEPWYVRWILIALAVGVMALLVLAPLASIIAGALGDGVHAYFESFKDPDTWSSIKLTILVAAIVVPLNVVFGLAAAWAIFDPDWYRKRYNDAPECPADELLEWHLTRGQARGNSPNRYFDEEWQRQAWPGILALIEARSVASAFDAWCGGPITTRAPQLVPAFSRLPIVSTSHAPLSASVAIWLRPTPKQEQTTCPISSRASAGRPASSDIRAEGDNGSSANRLDSHERATSLWSGATNTHPSNLPFWTAA